jgi:hypothetical protein
LTSLFLLAWWLNVEAEGRGRRGSWKTLERARKSQKAGEKAKGNEEKSPLRDEGQKRGS